MKKPQHSITLPQKMWDEIYGKYNHYGFRFPSQYAEDLITWALLTHPKYRKGLSKSDKEHLRAYRKVGKIAESVKPLVFMGRASRVYEDTKRMYEKNVELKLMTESEMNRNLNTLLKQLKVSVKTLDKDQREERKKRLMKEHGFVVSKSGKIKKA